MTHSTPLNEKKGGVAFLMIFLLFCEEVKLKIERNES